MCDGAELARLREAVEMRYGHDLLTKLDTAESRIRELERELADRKET